MLNGDAGTSPRRDVAQRGMRVVWRQWASAFVSRIYSLMRQHPTLAAVVCAFAPNWIGLFEI